MRDIIVVGGGLAGLNAALILGRQRRDVLVIDDGRPRNGPAEAVHGFLSRDGVGPHELREIAREELSAYASVELLDGEVTDAAPDRAGFAVATRSGLREHARSLLLAMGQYDDLPDVEGLAELFGRGVYHCPYCHGFEARDLPLAVLGGDLFAAPLALHLRMRISDDVVLCTNGAANFDAELRAKLDACGVAICEEPVVGVQGRPDAFERVIFASGDVLARGALFVRAPLRQHSGLAASVGCALRDDGTVTIDDCHRTTVAGVYAAGDITRRESYPIPLGQAIAAAADGATAAIWLDQELLAADIDARIAARDTHERLDSAAARTA